MVTEHNTLGLPEIKWIKNDPSLNWFEDGSRFLVALHVINSAKNTTRWEFEVLTVSCDGDWMVLSTSEGETFSGWEWEDFEYFHVLEGPAPIPRQECPEGTEVGK